MPQSQALRERLLEQVMAVTALDVHSHVPPQEPHAGELLDLLGYHYYTELAHSAGMPREALSPQRPAEELIPELLRRMEAIDNTVQYGWLIELATELFGFAERRLTAENWQPLDQAVRQQAERPDRARQIMEASRIGKVFLTNPPEEDLEEIDSELFVPSLRADAVVFHLADAEVREALEGASGTAVSDAGSLRRALAGAVERFAAHGARSAAISLPPGFVARRPEESEFERELQRALGGEKGSEGGGPALSSGVLFALVEQCRRHRLPMQVMYGVMRDAYPAGVHQGTDLPRAGATVAGLLPLLNAFPEVTFCLSALSESQVQELNSYGWLVRNVVLSGHWWYLNAPEYIRHDLGARLQTVPKTKLIGYYSDMYKLEFGLAKFNMYRRVLAEELARLVEARRATEGEAVELARLLLRGNAERIFGLGGD